MNTCDLSNVPEATAHTSTNVASFPTSAMAQTFHSDHSVVSDTSEEGSVKTHFSDDEMKALVDNQNNEQLSKATKLSYIKLRKKQKDEKEVNILLDGYSEGFDLRHKRIAYQYNKGMTINYMKKRMEIVHFYVNDSNKSIDIWAKSLTEKNAKAEKLDVNQMKCKKKTSSVHCTPQRNFQIGDMYRYPGRHEVEKKHDDGTREIKLKKKTALKKIEKKLTKCYFENESCVVCLESHEHGYMGNNPSCKLQHNNKPSACKSCIISMVVSKKDSRVECSRCAPKCTLFK